MSTIMSKREILRKKRQSQKRRRWIIFFLIFVGVILIFTLAAVLPKLLSKQEKYSDVQGFYIGDPNAPIDVVEFSSYYCSYCKSFSENSESNFVENYVATGDVYFRYVNMAPETAESLNAAEASFCAAEQNRFFDYKPLLFIYAAADNGFSDDALISYADTIGMDVDAFRTCMESDEFQNAYVDDTNYALEVGVTATPTFLINGQQLVNSNELIPTVETLLANQVQ